MSIGNSAKLKLNSLRFARVLPSGSTIGGGIYSVFAVANGVVFAVGNGNGGGIYSVFGIANGNGNAKSAVFRNSLLQISSGTKASG